MILLRRFALALGFATSAAVAVVLACGPHYGYVVAVRPLTPPHLRAYARGDLGVVRPKYERTFLVQAYRVMAGLPPVAALTESSWELINRRDKQTADWNTVPGGLAIAPWALDRATYSHFPNCSEDAGRTAARTYEARRQKYGPASSELRDWLEAQNAVFSNCASVSESYPKPAPPGADALIRADREYQTAAAYFYQLKFDEAAKRFSAIAANRESPWRPYGQYLAARSRIRNATLLEQSPERKRQLLESADAELRGVLSDPAAAHLHGSATGLRQFVAAQIRPQERLQEVARAMVAKAEPGTQEIIDFRILMDRLVGNTVDYAYTSGSALTDAHPLLDWIVAMQGEGAEATARVTDQWKKTGSTAWLVAALWRVPPRHSDVPALLKAAAAVERSSPAFPTVAFLRARTLAARGARAEARAILSQLPEAPARRFPAETVNLLDAMRFRLADTLDELLVSAARRPVWESGPFSKMALDRPVFDQDAAEVFTYHLPLARLVDAARSEALPDRLRVQVAGVAFSRAVVLGRHDAAAQAATVLRALAPVLAADLERFASAPDQQTRQRAAVRLLLRTPGIRGAIFSRDNEVEYVRAEPSRRFAHTGRNNLWCTTELERPDKIYPISVIVQLLYDGERVPAPAFLTAAERADVRRELAALRAAGPATTWLGKEAIAWANAAPSDLDAAEALALSVEAARWGCWNDTDPNTSRRAFQTLHRLFPRSEWARRTKYWY